MCYLVMVCWPHFRVTSKHIFDSPNSYIFGDIFNTTQAETKLINSFCDVFYLAKKKERKTVGKVLLFQCWRRIINDDEMICTFCFEKWCFNGPHKKNTFQGSAICNEIKCMLFPLTSMTNGFDIPYFEKCVYVVKYSNTYPLHIFWQTIKKMGNCSHIKLTSYILRQIWKESEGKIFQKNIKQNIVFQKRKKRCALKNILP